MNLLGIGMVVASSFGLHSGDRVVFYGDSITEQRHYTQFVEAFVRTRYPELDVHFFSRGWGGDATWGGGGGTIEQRVSQDVAPLKPSVVSIMLGMNDGGYVPYDSKIADTFKEWYGKLLGLMKSSCPIARITMAETSPWDQYAHELPPGPPKPNAWAPWDGYNEVLVHYGDVVKELAAKRGATFVDFNAPLVAALKVARVRDPKLAKEFLPDSIHPARPGAAIMATELVTAWGFDPLVSSVHIDASSKISTVEKAKVSNLTGLTWDQKDESFPLPLDTSDLALVLAWEAGGLGDKIGRQLVKVSGLGEGSYGLWIDGKAVTKATAEAWSVGINIGAMETPMHAQAMKVWDLVVQLSDMDFFRWRNVQREHGNLKSAPETIKALDRMEEELHAAQMKAAQPVTHHFELKKI